MNRGEVRSHPSVLDTTVLSNFAYIDQLQLLAGLSGIYTVPAVREELHDGVDDHPFLQAALDVLSEEIPVASISDAVANREAVLGDHLDHGEAQPFAVADAHGSRLLTDDGYDGTLAISECKYTSDPMTIGDFERLEKAAREKRWSPADGNDSEHLYCCFSRSGYSVRLVELGAGRDDVRLFDVPDVIDALTTE